MSTIDAHVHLYPPEMNRAPAEWAAANGEPHWAVLCTRRRKDGRAVQGFPSVDELLKAMDAAEVERAVLLGWYWERAQNGAAQNRFYGECVCAHPDRLSGFATVQPAAGAEAAVAEMRRAAQEGLIGLGELSPHAQGYGVEGGNFHAVLAVAAELGWPVNLHVTDPASGNYPGRVETPLVDFVRLAEAWPNVNFILAHWGGGLATGRGAGLKMENVFYDTAASPLLYDATVWARGTAAAGAERILFGSDFPLNVYPKLEPEAEMKRLLAEARGTGLAEGDLTAVLGGNARRVLLGGR